MLHEILLSLAGHPSPLLSTEHAGADGVDSVISPPERELLASVAHLGDLHVKLRTFAAQIGASHPSTICRAVGSAVESIHLHAFQQKVIAVEDTILRKDAALVGAYDIVPLTAVVGEFSGWTRRLEWLWDVVRFMLRPDKTKGDKAGPCTGARIIDRLRQELQTGFEDVEETARSLVRVAEVAWLKQVSSWILYGRLPSFGDGDFFVQKSDESDQGYVSVPSLLPSFVTPSAAASALFIGTSLIHIRAKGSADRELHGTDHLSSQLKELSKLTFPLDGGAFARAITDIRLFLSRTTLQKLLPLAKVVELLQLLRDFFLLGRGEFAMALTQQAELKIRSRWKRADNLAYEKREGLANVVVKDGEVAAVLGATWAALGSMQGQHADEDEGLELARDLLRLNIAHHKNSTPAKSAVGSIATTPFRNLLFSVPAVLTLQIPSPLDLFLTTADAQAYSAINAYLLSVRRAHLHLTDLWKVSPLRRHHPPPPAPPYKGPRDAHARVVVLRRRHELRSNVMRGAWATSSAAIFFLAETEAYLQTEVVAGLWEGFQRWLTTGADEPRQEKVSKTPKPATTPVGKAAVAEDDQTDEDGDDVWLAVATSELAVSPSSSRQEQQSLSHPPQQHRHDPQTLATAHRVYLRTLARRLLLTRQSFTEPLYELLVRIDRLVALIHRLHAIWTAADLEADAGVVDAFVDLDREEAGVRRELRAVEDAVRTGVQGVVAVLRTLEDDGRASAGDEVGGDGTAEGAEDGDDDVAMREAGMYVPRRIGGLDRLLMKLNFGTWFDSGGPREEDDDEDD